MTEDEEHAAPEAEAAPPSRLTSEGRADVLREAVTMTLYVSVVLIAELAAIPEKHFAHGRVTGAVGVAARDRVGYRRRCGRRPLVRLPIGCPRVPRRTAHPTRHLHRPRSDRQRNLRRSRLQPSRTAAV